VSFDFLAPHYHWLEGVTFGNKLQTARVAFLDQVNAPGRVLIAGEGNGRFLRSFLQKYPEAAVDSVDASAQMLRLAQERAGDKTRIRFLHEDITLWSPPENTYDLIVTHFFLDCFTRDEVAQVVAKLARSATGRAVWLVADFSVPPRGIARIHARIWLKVMYRFFRLTTRISASELVEPARYLSANGFERVARRRARFGLITSELWRRDTKGCNAVAAL
jgi:ubiquinone/menaquinone biosynthesis C-methylase UbiE